MELFFAGGLYISGEGLSISTKHKGGQRRMNGDADTELAG